jgi:hypothetical protein
LFAAVLQTPEMSSRVLYFLDAEEVSGSNPLSPTLKDPVKQDKTKDRGFVHRPCRNAGN